MGQFQRVTINDQHIVRGTFLIRLQDLGRDAHTVYVEPRIVVEIAFNDVQASPHYPSGMALRFARVKGYRPDKRPEDADTLEAVSAIHDKAIGLDPA